ncbi:MAG TPA: hypothetical protein PKE39_08845 [Ignavibacteria bacterium]|nr:hypothetical protein [Ignavibacteria bacterium]HMQ99117.1 hypothetical protein [Ignavibacteria bacterium]
MREKNKYIDEIIDAKLRKSRLSTASGDFTSHLMKRITAENKALMEEKKSDRVVKYIIGSFSFMMLAFTFAIGLISKSAAVNTDETTGVAFDTMQRSSSWLESMVYYIQGFFTNVLSFFGLSLSSSSINIILVVILVAVIYLVGERLFLRGKMKQSMQVK